MGVQAHVTWRDSVLLRLLSSAIKKVMKAAITVRRSVCYHLFVNDARCMILLGKFILKIIASWISRNEDVFESASLKIFVRRAFKCGAVNDIVRGGVVHQTQRQF